MTSWPFSAAICKTVAPVSGSVIDKSAFCAIKYLRISLSPFCNKSDSSGKGISIILDSIAALHCFIKAISSSEEVTFKHEVVNDVVRNSLRSRPSNVSLIAGSPSIAASFSTSKALVTDVFKKSSKFFIEMIVSSE